MIPVDCLWVSGTTFTTTTTTTKLGALPRSAEIQSAAAVPLRAAHTYRFTFPGGMRSTTVEELDTENMSGLKLVAERTEGRQTPRPGFSVGQPPPTSPASYGGNLKLDRCGEQAYRIGSGCNGARCWWRRQL